jgi:hypothetical protein
VTLMADLITISLTDTYQIEVFDKGTLVDPTLFNYESSNTDTLDVDGGGLVSPSALGLSTVTVTRITDNSIVSVPFQVAAVTHDYHVAVQIQPAPDPITPPIPLTGKLLSNNCGCTLLTLTNGVEGYCQLQVGQVRLPASSTKAYRFILYKEVYGKGLVAARSDLYLTWPVGEIFSLVHPAVGILTFQVNVGSTPIQKGTDDVQIGNPTTDPPLLGATRYTSAVSPSTNIEAMWMQASLPLPTPPIDPNAGF